MNPLPPPLPPLRQPVASARATRWVILLIASLAIAAGLIITFAFLRYRSGQVTSIRKLEAAIRAEGSPVTIAELAAQYPHIPDAENAAAALIALWQKEDPEWWTAFLGGQAPLPKARDWDYDPALPYLGREARTIPRGEPLAAPSLQAAQEFLAEHQARFETVRAALTRPHWRFPINLTNGYASQLPHLSRLRQEAIFFQIAALVAAERNDSAAALTALRNTTRVGQLLAKEPLLISQLVRLACQGLTLTATEQWLSRQALPRAELDQVRDVVTATDLSGVAHFALVSERPNALAAFDPDMAAYLATPDNSTATNETEVRRLRQGFTLVGATGYFRPDQRLMLETFQEAIRLARQETPAALEAYESLFAEVATRARRFPPKIFSALLLPALQKVLPRFATHEARRRAALVAVAIENYRRDHAEQLPAQLADLLPTYLAAIPADPFVDASLRYHPLERGYVIYSVGPDRQDHGGQERTKHQLQGTDVTFTVAR